VRARFWIELALAAASALSLAVTVVTPEWIEVVFGVDPDGGSGALEVAIAAGLLASTLVFGVLARLERRRPATSR
jgi:hypothetical protein